MKKHIALFATASALLFVSVSCSNSSETDSTDDSQQDTLVQEPANIEEARLAAQGELPEGLEIEIVEEGDGILPMMGQQMTVHYRGTLDDGRVFDESYTRGKPFKFKVGVGQAIPGWDRALSTMSKGTKANITIPAHLAYADNNVPGIPPGSTLHFEVEVLNISDGPKPINHKPWSKDGIKRELTKNGVEIYTIEKGEGAKIQPGQVVEVHYHGELLGGEKFDSSFDRGEPIEFPLGQGRVIPGWEEAIATMTIGTKAKLIIPPFLAYGDQGAGNAIPPNSTLVFDIQIMGAR